jgi:hypothetical protein
MRLPWNNKNKRKSQKKVYHLKSFTILRVMMMMIITKAKLIVAKLINTKGNDDDDDQSKNLGLI